MEMKVLIIDHVYLFFRQLIQTGLSIIPAVF